ncbi:MAG: alpha/beta hydrolase fold domain-containing protein [Lachnospiraceae bacterium]
MKAVRRTAENPYSAPLLARDFSHLPDTLILTAEFDPLRDEGENWKEVKRSRKSSGDAPDQGRSPWIFRPGDSIPSCEGKL